MTSSDADTSPNEPEWVLPAQIPFADLKRDDLEACVYWLLDAMGARDLEWRKGGAGSGTADGGRDLEAKFYEPNAEGEPTAKAWWVECKGRAGTVEPQAVKDAAVNALARADLHVLVVATNTVFSNPTRDWVRDFQQTHPRLRILLWDQPTLERLISRHPSVVLRLFGGALSLAGRLRAAEERFWNRLEYVPAGTLESLWKDRERLELNPMAAVALITNEFAGGSITARPWGGFLEPFARLGALQIGLINAYYLVLRSQRSGVSNQPLVRCLAYLILVAVDVFNPKAVTALIVEAAGSRDGLVFPKDVTEYILMPVLDQLQSEVEMVCAADCLRMSAGLQPPGPPDPDDPEAYWTRVGAQGRAPVEPPTSRLRIESTREPCKVGFAVDETVSCPLFATAIGLDSVEELLTVIEKVAMFRASGVPRRPWSDEGGPGLGASR